MSVSAAPAIAFSCFSSLADHVAGSLVTLLRLSLTTSAALTTSIGWFGYFFVTFCAGVGLASAVVLVALCAVAAATISIFLLAIALFLLSVCGSPVLALAVLLVLFAAFLLLWLARWFATFVEDRWPNLAQYARLDRVRRFCHNMLVAV